MLWLLLLAGPSPGAFDASIALRVGTCQASGPGRFERLYREHTGQEVLRLVLPAGCPLRLSETREVAIRVTGGALHLTAGSLSAELRRKGLPDSSSREHRHVEVRGLPDGRLELISSPLSP